jgi:hypothetical protein
MAVVGYRYYFGIHMGIGRGPVNELCEIRVGDRRAWIGSATGNTTINISKPNLFGGDEREGGIEGPLELMFGEPTQTASAGLLAMLGAPQPGFRRRFTAFFNGLISSNNPYPKPWKFRLRRTTAGWDGPVFAPEYATILIEAEEPSDVETEPTEPAPIDFTSPPAGWMPTTDSDPAGVLFPYYGGVGWWGKPPATTIDTAGEPPAGWIKSFINDPLARWFGNASDPWWYAPAPSVPTNPDTSGNPPPGWVLTYAGDPYGIFFPNISGGEGSNSGWFKPPPEGNTVTEPPADWVATTSTDSFRVLFPYYGYYKPPGAGVPTPPTPTGVEAVFIHAMNPAHIIYECLTNREWGRGMSRTRIDEDSFLRAAIQLHTEKFGLCMKWVRTDEIQAFVQTVLDHIGATLFLSRKTAKMTLRLIRGDYDFDALRTYTNDTGLLEIRESAFAPPGLSVNQIQVQYHNPLNDKDRSVTVGNNAAIRAAGGVVNSATRQYKGIPVPSLALRVGQRDLRASSTSLRRFQIVMDRRGFEIEPGSVIAVEDRVRGIPKMALRVGRIDAGNLVNGKITITAIQDVFSLPARSFVNAVPPTWTPPTIDPCIDEQRAIEVPYFILAGAMRPADLAYVNENGGFVALLNSQGKPLNAGAKLAVRSGAPTPDDTPPDGSYLC